MNNNFTLPPQMRHTRVGRLSQSGEAAPPKTVNHPCSRNRNQNLILLEP